jgi:GT2 family glycosyltransferase
MAGRDITLSVVSHGQNGLVNALLQDLEKHCGDRVEILITENIPDDTPLSHHGIRNQMPKGFGANHNAAFTRCATTYFCVCNPDIRLASDPFPALLRALQEERAAVAGPLVRNPMGEIEDSARHFPTAVSLIRKFFGEKSSGHYPADRGTVDVDWVAGMFMLFRAEAFRSIKGFDERYFLYYEDVDLCRRLHEAGSRILYEPRGEVIHDARRASRHNPTLALHHAKSGLRFLLTR